MELMKNQLTHLNWTSEGKKHVKINESFAIAAMSSW